MNATQHGYASDQKRIIARLNRIEGQVRGIRQMTENGEYCIDILTQISAADSALKSVALLLLDDHLHHCVAKAAAEGGTVADEKLAEVSAAIARLAKKSEQIRHKKLPTGDTCARRQFEKRITVTGRGTGRGRRSAPDRFRWRPCARPAARPA